MSLLFTISEPDASHQPSSRTQHRAAGIDLGTTHSLIASRRAEDHQIHTLENPAGDSIIPSIVAYQPDGKAIVGKAAVGLTDAVCSVKRLLGRDYQEVCADPFAHRYTLRKDESHLPLIVTPAGDKTPVEISAAILGQLREMGEKALGGVLEGVVITVPAHFDDARRQATRDAARFAGLRVLRLLNEPTAAAICYGLDQREQNTIAVYDLGGGTFDISILRLERGIFQVLATGGDVHLGGDDFDQLIVNWALKQAKISPERIERANLLHTARIVKETLTREKTVTFAFENHYASWKGMLTRETFSALIHPWIQRSLEICKQTLHQASLETAMVNEVVLVGGSTRVPAVVDAITAFFGRTPRNNLDPERVVALGAAIQADILIGNKRGQDILLLDVTPLSLGIETLGGLVERIIPRNTTIPVTRAQEFTTSRDGQRAILIHVVQGERELVKDCRSLAHFELRGIPPQPAGIAKLRVTFQIDADGLLSVTAMETRSNIQAQVMVKPTYGLAQSQVTALLERALAHTQSDQQVRALREQTLAAERLIAALDQALKEDDALLSQQERASLETAISELQNALKTSQLDSMQTSTARLQKKAESFLQQRMERMFNNALRNTSVTTKD